MTAADSVDKPRPAKPGKYFTWAEFECHDVIGTPYPVNLTEMGVALGAELDRIRERIGAFVPTSVYRTWQWHCAIYARMVPKQTPPVNSGHLFGRAADVPCPDRMDWTTFAAAVLDAAREKGSQLTYIRFYRHDKFAHVEIRRTLKALKVEYADA